MLGLCSCKQWGQDPKEGEEPERLSSPTPGSHPCAHLWISHATSGAVILQFLWTILQLPLEWGKWTISPTEHSRRIWWAGQSLENGKFCADRLVSCVASSAQDADCTPDCTKYHNSVRHWGYKELTDFFPPRNLDCGGNKRERWTQTMAWHNICRMP